jgi:hypothetical protein
VHFDQRAEARAIHIVHVFKVDDNFCSAGCEKILNGCAKAVALFPEHETPFERENVDSIDFALRYF